MYYSYNADEPLPTASVCKVAVLVELLRQDHEGILRLDERYQLRPNISSHGTGTLHITRDYPTLTVRDYARLMMGVSDNMATDMCIGLVGPDNIAAIMEKVERREMISPAASECMIEMMKVPKNPNRIRQYLKPEIVTARKTGGSGRIKADTGIVYLSSGALVIAGLATSDDRAGGQAGMDAIAAAARLVYETLAPESVLEE